jgi:hypothetical protein
MKKIILLSVLLVIACTSEDNDNTNTSIEGRWNLTSSSVEEIGVCSQQTYMQLSNNNSGVLYEYYTDFPDNPEIEPCGLDGAYDISYSQISDNTYNFILDYGGGDTESAEATVSDNVLTLFSSDEGFDVFITFTRD